MKKFNPGSCACSHGWYWPAQWSTAFDPPSATVFLSTFCSLATDALLPAPSRPLGVNVELKKIIYRRGSTQEIWEKDLNGTTSVRYVAGDVYTNALNIRDMYINESTGFGWARTGLNTSASFNVTSGNYVNGPYTSQFFGSVDVSGNVYYGVNTTGTEFTYYRNAVLQGVYSNQNLVYSGGVRYQMDFTILAIENNVYSARRRIAPSPGPWEFVQLAGGAGPGDHSALFEFNELGNSLAGVFPDKDHAPIQRGYYNFSTNLVDLPISLGLGQGEVIVRFSTDLSRNSTVASSGSFTRAGSGGLISFIIKDG